MIRGAFKKYLSVIFITGLMMNGISTSAYAFGDNHSAVSSGRGFAMVIMDDGTLCSYGINDSGRLGRKSGESLEIPTRIMDNVVAVSAGEEHAMAVKADGTLWGWGSNLGVGTLSLNESVSSYKVNYRMIPTKIMDDDESVSAGLDYTMAIKTDGTLWGWGSNCTRYVSNSYISGQIGISDEEYVETPVKIMDDVESVSAGARNTMAIKKDHSLWGWGENDYGQLGDGTTEIRLTPIKIMDDVLSVYVGAYETMAIKTDGSLWMWGRCNENNGYLGTGMTEYKEEVQAPKKIMDDVVFISTYISNLSMAVKSDGSLWCWGSDSGGLLGDGSDGYQVISTPKKIMDNVVSVSTGFAHTLVSQTDGSLWEWGHKQGIDTYPREKNLTRRKILDNVLLPNSSLKIPATSISSKVFVDNQQVAFDAYIIKQESYFKLRDLATVLDGTDKRFEMNWDSNKKVIHLLTNKPYTVVGGELAKSDGTSKNAIINTYPIYLDGKEISLTAYTIGGNNYFKLRDLGQMLNFDVSWDSSANTIIIDTSKGYSAE